MYSPSNRPQRDKSFIKYFIGIAFFYIICIIMIPVFMTPRSHIGRHRICQNNLKQYTAAIMMYTMDSDKRYPTRYIGTTADANRPDRNPGRPGWIHNALRPQLKNDLIVECPFASDTKGTWPAMWDESGQHHLKNTSYASYTYNYARLTNAADKDIELPAETAMMWDSMNNFLDEQGGDVPCGEDGRCGEIVGSLKNGSVNVKLAFNKFKTSNGDLYRYCSAEERNPHWVSNWMPGVYNSDERNKVMWHQGRGNVAWADGHVTSHSFETLFWSNIFKVSKKLAGDCYDKKPLAQCDINSAAIMQ